MDIERGDSGYVYTLVGHVWVKTEEYEITAGRGKYYEQDSLSELWKDVVVRGRNYILKSDYLKYRSPDEYLLLEGKVFLEDSLRRIKSRWIEVIRKVARAKGDVYVFLKNRNVSVEGDSAIYNINSGVGTIWGDISIQILRDGDTVHIDTRMLHVEKENFTAIPLIKLTSSTEEASGDTLHYILNRDSTETAIIKGNAFVRWSDGEGKADTIEIIYRQNQILRAIFKGNAVVSRRDSTRYFYIEADRVDVWFSSGRVQRVLSDFIRNAYIREE